MQHLNRLLTQLKPRHDDVVVDRFNYIYTPMMFFGFATTIAAKQYVGQPLQCWPPAEFKSAWESYLENLCFVENTYYVNIGANRFPSARERASRELPYYQWVAFFLAAQMLLFMIPKCLWNAFNWKTGISISSMVNQAMVTTKKTVLKDPEEAQISSRMVASRMEVTFRAAAAKYTRHSNKHNKGEEISCEYEFIDYRTIKPQRNFVTFLYIVFKVLNLLNGVVQLYFLNAFLGPEYQLWGIGVITDLLNGQKWRESGHFPRVTFCDAEIRQSGNLGPLKFTVQCVLMINMFNEKIYIFVWFWLLGLSFLNILDCIHWMWISMFWSSQIRFVKNRMTNMRLSVDNKEELNIFVKRCLCRDGCTTLRLIDHNCGEIICGEILRALWSDFKKNLALSNQKLQGQTPCHTVSSSISNSRSPSSSALPRTGTASSPGYSPV